MAVLNLGELAGNRSVSYQALGSASHPQTPELRPHRSMRSMLTGSLPGPPRPERAQTARAATPGAGTLSIRGRTFSCVCDEPLQTPVAREPLADLVQQAAASKLARASLAEELLAERTPRSARHVRSPSQTLTFRRRTPGLSVGVTAALGGGSTSTASGGSSSSSSSAVHDALMLSVGAAAAQTREHAARVQQQVQQEQQAQQQQVQQVQQVQGQQQQQQVPEEIFGGTVEEQAAAAVREGRPAVPAFVQSVVAKLRAFGPKEDERALRAMWEACGERDVPRDVLAERSAIENGRLCLDAITIEARHVVLLLAEYLRALAAPLVAPGVLRLLLPPALAGYDDVELAVAILPGLWALSRAAYDTLRTLVLALRDLYVVPALSSSSGSSSSSDEGGMRAAWQVAAVLAGPLFQCPARDERQRHACVRLAACLLYNGADLFAAAPQLAYEPERDGQPRLVACATPPLLVETLTNEFYGEESFSYLFLLTYQYYMTHEEMYSILVTHFQRWFGTPAGEGECAPWRERKRTMIQSAICRWVRVRGSELVVDAERVVELLRAQFGGAAATDTMSVGAYLDYCYAHVPAAVYIPEHGSDASSRRLLSVLRQDVRALAEQLALFHQRLFRAIPISELIKKKKPNPDIPDSDIFASTFTQVFNKLSGWLTAAVVAARDDAERAELLVAAIRLAKALLRLNNFHGAMAVSTALQHSAVARLHGAWDRVPRKRVAAADALRELFDPKFMQYRAAVDRCSPPGVPCFVPISNDLSRLEENIPTWLPERGAPNAMVNVDKLRKIAKVLQQVRLFQLTPYPFQPIPGLQEDLTKLPVLDDKTLYSLSTSAASSSTS